MDLYYDGECFIYTDGRSKFIVHPNYKMKVAIRREDNKACLGFPDREQAGPTTKINRDIVKRVNFITATRRTDKKEFNGMRYIKI